MKPPVVAMIVFCAAFSFAAHACNQGSLVELGRAWGAIRPLAEKKDVVALSSFFRFPVQLLSMEDPNRSMKTVGKKQFLKYYDVIFVGDVPGQTIFLQDELLKSKDDEYLRYKASFFDEQGCSKSGVARVLDYNFRWVKKDGWKVVSVYYDKTDLDNYNETLKMDMQ